jgi:hypothetical protein
VGLTNAGRDIMAASLTGDSTTHFDNTNAHIGVGDSSTTFSAAQTDLIGTSKLRKGMDIAFPVTTGNVMDFKTTFATDEANFAWNEWGVFNAAAGATMLDRVVEYNGTKLAGQTWVFQVTLTVSIGA